jgi:hypothetical protein
MDGEQFPNELEAALASTFDRYRNLGWTNIQIGWPTGADGETRMIFLHATAPSGQRVHTNFEDDEHLVDHVAEFLRSQH